jgi:glycosyltransferase involved in cell wall biosynthesis
LGKDRAMVVVVDNAPDGTALRLCSAYREKMAVPLHFAEEPERGISMARNRALALAMGLGADRVAFLDDDDLPEPDWLRRLLEHQRRSDADLVFGLASPAEGAEIPYLLRELDEFRPRSLTRLNRYGLPAAAGTCNLLLHRRLVEALLAQGPVFLPELAFTGGGDSDLFVRAQRAGFRSATAPESLVVTGMEPHRPTVRGALRRSYRYGVSQIAVASRHLPAGELRLMRRSARRKLLKGLWRLPAAALSPPRLVARLAELARALGKLSAFRGGRYRYYG